MAVVKPTVGFNERYATDDEFKRQVDDGRKRSETKRGQQELRDSLAMVRGDRTAKKKLY